MGVKPRLLDVDRSADIPLIIEKSIQNAANKKRGVYDVLLLERAKGYNGSSISEVLRSEDLGEV